MALVASTDLGCLHINALLGHCLVDDIVSSLASSSLLQLSTVARSLHALCRYALKEWQVVHSFASSCLSLDETELSLEEWQVVMHEFYGVSGLQASICDWCQAGHGFTKFPSTDQILECLNFVALNCSPERVVCLSWLLFASSCSVALEPVAGDPDERFSHTVAALALTSSAEFVLILADMTSIVADGADGIRGLGRIAIHRDASATLERACARFGENDHGDVVLLPKVGHALTDQDEVIEETVHPFSFHGEVDDH